MKFINTNTKTNLLVITLITITILSVLTTISSTSNNLSHKLKLKTNTNTKEDFLSYFAKLDNNNKSTKSINNNNNDANNIPKIKFKSREKSDPAAAACQGSQNCPLGNNTCIPTPNEPGTDGCRSKYPNDCVLQEDWMAISSMEFKAVKRFPPVKLPDGKEVKIKVTGQNFRVNHAANCTDPHKPDDDRNFWFRLDHLHIYYASTNTDINILGSMTVKDIDDINDNEDYSGEHEYYCFTITDKNFDTGERKWKICSVSEDKRDNWSCRIKHSLGKQDKKCTVCGDSNIKVVEKKITKPIIMIPLPSPVCNADWDYQKNGADWDCDCEEGKEQSPIDLPRKEEAVDSPVKPVFQYKDVPNISSVSTIDGVVIAKKKTKIENKDNHLSIKGVDFGKITTLDGAVYQAEEITFHSPANHKINGKTYDLEMNVLHYGMTKGDIGKQVVLSFVFESSPGTYNNFIDDIDFFNLPNPIMKERDIENSLFIPKIFYSNDGDKKEEIPLMKPFSFYTYQGSLPFPPCTERTITYVAAKPVPLSSTAIMLFKEALRVPDMMNTKTQDIHVSNTLPKSNRNTQPKNGRPVFYYDHVKYCGPDPNDKPIKPAGHYERIKMKATQYFYVNGERPSGIPGSFVVSKKEAMGEKTTPGNREVV